MSYKQPVVYFNNCHNRDHVALFGSGAFFDLGTSGRQGTQARNLKPGQSCVVAERDTGEHLVLDWYSFKYESLLTDEMGKPDRVFYGRIFASETLTKEAAARNERYAGLFRSNGHLKIGSVFHRDIPEKLIPPRDTSSSGRKSTKRTKPKAPTGAGFGDAAENKLVEMAAVRTVVQAYENDGWSWKSVERDKCGYDLECSKGNEIEHVEVKGVRGTELTFIITAGEVEQARNNKRFRIVAVTSALSKRPKLKKYSGAQFCRDFKLVTIQYRATLAK